MDIVEFKNIIYGLGQVDGLNIVEINQPGVTPNFFAAELEFSYGDDRCWLVCNLKDEWALAEWCDLSFCSLKFKDDEFISSALKELFDIEVLSKSVLDQPFILTEAMCERDVKYWKPSSLGEGAFNWWD